MATLTKAGASPLDVVLMEADLERGSQNHVIQVIGRADPVVVFGTQSARAGRLVFRCVSWAAAEHVSNYCHGARVVLGAPEHPALHGMPFVCTHSQTRPDARAHGGWVFTLTLDVYEVA